MLDSDDNLVTNTKKIEDLAIETYKKRLENRPIKAGLENIQKEKDQLCIVRSCKHE